MRIEFTPTAAEVQFVISDVEPKYESVLKSLFYKQDGSSFTKSFAATLASGRVQGNFARYALPMFDQIGGFAPVPWERAVEQFAQRASAAGIDWWLTGSCALAARGILVAPHDVDIMLHSADVAKVESTLADFIVEPIISTEGWIMSHFGVAFLDARIDLAFDPHASVDQPQPADFGPYAQAHLETINWHGIDLLVPPVALHLNSNRQRGRLDRVALIEEYMRR